MSYHTGADWRSFSADALAAYDAALDAGAPVRVVGPGGEVITAVPERKLHVLYTCGCAHSAHDHNPDRGWASWSFSAFVCDEHDDDLADCELA